MWVMWCWIVVRLNLTLFTCTYLYIPVYTNRWYSNSSFLAKETMIMHRENVQKFLCSMGIDFWERCAHKCLSITRHESRKMKSEGEYKGGGFISCSKSSFNRGWLLETVRSIQITSLYPSHPPPSVCLPWENETLHSR